MDMPGWMTSVKQQLTELDRRVRTMGSDLSFISTTRMPYIRAVASAAQLVGFGAWVKLTQWSLSNTHPDISYSAGTFTINKDGLYDIRFTAMFRNEISSAGVRGVAIFFGGATQIAGYYAPPIVAQGDYASSHTETVYRLVATNTIDFRVLQNTAGNVNIHVDPFTQCSIRRVGD